MLLKNGEGALNPLALQQQKVSFRLNLKDFVSFFAFKLCVTCVIFFEGSKFFS